MIKGWSSKKEGLEKLFKSSIFRIMLKKLLRLIPLKHFRNPVPKVAVLQLHGVIGRTSLIGSSGMTFSSLEKTIQKCFKVNGIKAVAVSINSPGGSPVQSSLIAQHLMDLSQENNIGIYAFVEDVAASGGYWLACAADEIFANENSILGSIGVVSAGFGFSKALDKLGVERRVYTSGQSKSMLDPFKPEKPEEVKKLKEIQEDIHQSFCDYVTERRGKRLSRVDVNLFEGDIWTGKRAAELGLIDGIGSLHSTMRKRFGDETKFHIVNQRRNPWRRFFAGGEAKFGRQVSDLVSALDEWWLWKRFGL